MSCTKTATQNTFGGPLATDERHRPLYDVEHACIFNFFAGNQKNLLASYDHRYLIYNICVYKISMVTTGGTCWAITELAFNSHAAIFEWQPF
jgi:hypothetical protein